MPAARLASPWQSTPTPARLVSARPQVSANSPRYRSAWAQTAPRSDVNAARPAVGRTCSQAAANVRPVHLVDQTEPLAPWTPFSSAANMRSVQIVRSTSPTPGSGSRGLLSRLRHCRPSPALAVAPASRLHLPAPPSLHAVVFAAASRLPQLTRSGAAPAVLPGVPTAATGRASGDLGSGRRRRPAGLTPSPSNRAYGFPVHGGSVRSYVQNPAGLSGGGLVMARGWLSRSTHSRRSCTIDHRDQRNPTVVRIEGLLTSSGLFKTSWRDPAGGAGRRDDRAARRPGERHPSAAVTALAITAVAW